MIPEEVNELLITAAKYDRRTIGQADIEAWYMILEPYVLGECETAVVAWYREHREFVMPSDIRKLVRAERQIAHLRALPATHPTGKAYARVAALLAGRGKAAKDECAANRAAVLRHPDLAAKLTAPAIGYSRAEQWNGFVPPEGWGEHNQPNNSMRRAALIEILTEALLREEAA
jgi:hypothetical protein